MDWSPPGSSVHGISQARILEWVAISFSRGSSQIRDQTHIFCIAGGFFTTEPPETLVIACFASSPPKGRHKVIVSSLRGNVIFISLLMIQRNESLMVEFGAAQWIRDG